VAGETKRQRARKRLAERIAEIEAMFDLKPRGSRELLAINRRIEKEKRAQFRRKAER